jgi:hypothetical protein
MSNTSVGSTRLAVPISKPVGAQHAPPSVGSGSAPAQVSVPSPTSLIINGVRTSAIDVRTMGPSDIVNAINNSVRGITASIDGQGRLVITGINSIDGDANLRAILGI